MFTLLRHQLALMISALLVLAVLAAMISSCYIITADYEQQSQQNNAAFADSLAANIQQFMYNAYNVTELLAVTYPERLALPEPEQKRWLQYNVTQQSYLQLLVVYGLNGDSIARSSGRLVNRSERWWFKKFMQEQHDFISHNYYSLFSNSPIITIVHGIQKDAQLAAVFMADIEVNRLQQMVENYYAGVGSYAYLLDAEGTVIAHPNRNQVSELHNYKTQKKSVLVKNEQGIPMLDAKDEHISQEEDFAVAASLQQLVAKVMSGESGEGEFTELDGTENICAFRTIYLPGNSGHWNLIVVQKKSVAMALIRNVIIKDSWVCVAVLLIAGLLTIWFSRRFTQPLSKIVAGAKKVKGGDLSVRLAVAEGTEIGLVAANFNQMVAELAETRQGLEKQIEARTSELNAAHQEVSAINETLLATNVRLTAEIKSRQQTEDDLLLRERQYRAITSLLTRPAHEMDGLLEAILRNAAKLLRAEDGSIGLYDRENDALQFCHALGEHRQFMKELQPAAEGMQSVVFATGEMFWVEDYRTYSKRVPDPRLERITSTIMIPLKSGTELTGILTICWLDEVHKVTIEDIQVLNQFADLAAVALERVRSIGEISQMAFHDSLTGLPNRASLHLFLETEMTGVQRGLGAGALLFIDLDELKSVNDNFGHSCGDEVIVSASRHIVETVGKSSFVSRIGGDEFIVVIPGQNERQAVEEIVSVLVRQLSQEYCVSAERLHLTASIGVAIYPDDGNDVEDILKKADAAMYVAKTAGRNCWRFYEPAFLQDAYEKLKLTNGLRHGCARQEFFLHYQAQTTTDGGKISGFEALLRWHSKEHGLISPTRFIPLAEQSGLIVEIGQFVLNEACAFAAMLAEQGQGHIRVAVNVSPRQLLNTDFVGAVRKTIAIYGIRPEQLEMEITENALIESMAESIEKLEQLRAMGIRLSLDDFGTGYSSLTYLRRLPVEILKIDKSFIDQIATDDLQMQVVAKIIDFGHALGLEVVAEGVEDAKQLQVLGELGCDRIQGFLFSKPVTQENALQLLQEN